jgi:hypothetical protein
MLGRSRAGFALGSLLLAQASCKDGGSSGQDSRPLPTPEPPASAAPAVLPGDAPAPAKKRALEEAKEPAKARPVAEPGSENPVAAPPAPSAAAAPGSAATGTAGAPTLPPTASVPTVTAPSAACLSRCQGALQGCLSQPVDGGVPGFGNLDLCKKAFEACQAACK